METTKCWNCGKGVLVTAWICLHCKADDPAKGYVPPLKRVPTPMDLAIPPSKPPYVILAFIAILIIACGTCIGVARSRYQNKLSEWNGGRSPQTGRVTARDKKKAFQELQYISIHQERIKNHLKDPSSAEFRGVRVSHAVAPVVCGEINSQNSFGGYSGYQRFISGGNVQVLEEEMAPGEMEKTWNEFCQ